MNIFNKATNMQAYLKMGVMGFAGSGKTHTSSLVAIGLHKLTKSNKPVYFLDTETGSDWVKPMFDEAQIELFTARTRAFADLVPAVKEAEKEGAILMIDSITHFWTELCDSYAKKLGRKNGLQFQDWGKLKGFWRTFTDEFVNSKAHIILCGRAGYEYDMAINEDTGRKELEKTGIKMKAEGEMGYEPSLLVLMERSQDMHNGAKIVRTAHILKDRSRKLDGKSIVNPDFTSFKPHIDSLNLGGQHMGVDTSKDSQDMIENPKSDWGFMQQQKEIALQDIEGLLTENFPGQTKEEKLMKSKLIKEGFNLEVANWARVQTMSLEELQAGFEKIKALISPTNENQDQTNPNGVDRKKVSTETKIEAEVQ